MSNEPGGFIYGVRNPASNGGGVGVTMRVVLFCQKVATSACDQCTGARVIAGTGVRTTSVPSRCYLRFSATRRYDLGGHRNLASKVISNSYRIWSTMDNAADNDNDGVSLPLLLADGTPQQAPSSCLPSFTYGFFDGSTDNLIRDGLATYVRSALPFVTDAHQVIVKMVMDRGVDDLKVAVGSRLQSGQGFGRLIPGSDSESRRKACIQVSECRPPPTTRRVPTHNAAADGTHRRERCICLQTS